MWSLDPSGDPGTALKNGWAVERPKWASVVEIVARRLELEPWSIHLLVGGVGSGKTTELLRIHDRLQAVAQESGDLTKYIDVGTEQRLDRVRAGVLVALAGRRLIRAEERARKALGGAGPTARVLEARNALKKLAEGYEIHVQRSDDDYGPDDYDFDEPPDYHIHYVRGVLESPTEPLAHRIAQVLPDLRVLRAATTSSDGHVIFLFDSLDRLPAPDQFEPAVKDDVRALKDAGIGAVVVGPMRFQYGAARAISELFENNVHFLSELEPLGDGLSFLIDVLGHRVREGVMSSETCQEIARASGGVLRDLISIAKGAAEEAYVAGSNAVLLDHVHRAADRFGRVRAVGLDGEQVQALRKVRETGTLVLRGEREVTLLETRRVLDYGAGRFVVHPVIAPLLDAMTETA